MLNFYAEMTGLVDKGRAADRVYLDTVKGEHHRQAVDLWGG